MENVLNEKETQNVKVKQEASQKAMKAILAMAAIFSLATVCVVIFCQLFVFSFLINSL